MNKHDAHFAHMLCKVRLASAEGIADMTTGDAIAAALVLNRPDWLATMNFTVAEAIYRIGPDGASLVPSVAREFEREKNSPS